MAISSVKQPALTWAEAVRMPALPPSGAPRTQAALRSIRAGEDIYRRARTIQVSFSLDAPAAKTGGGTSARERAAYHLAARPFTYRRVTGTARSTGE